MPRWILPTLLLTLSTATGLGAEPVTTLAMARPVSVKRTAALEPARQILSLAPPSLAANRLSTNAPAFPAPEKFSSIALQLSAPAQAPRSTSLLQLSWRDSASAGALTGWASARLEAGYGTPLDDLPVPLHGRNGTAWEEPSYGYLMVRFTF